MTASAIIVAHLLEDLELTPQGPVNDLMPMQEAATITRQAITRAVRQTFQEYRAAGKVKCAYDVGSGVCEEFAYAVLEKLGNSHGGVKGHNVDAIEYANLTGPPGCEECDNIFYPETLQEFKIKLPPDVTVDLLNKSGLGDTGTHIFIRWNSPQGYAFFDAETPQGVDSPFLLPFAERYLNIARFDEFNRRNDPKPVKEAEEPDYIETMHELRPDTAARVEAEYKRFSGQRVEIEGQDAGYSSGRRNYQRIDGKWYEEIRRRNPAYWDQPQYWIIYPGPPPAAFIACKSPRRLTSHKFGKAAAQIFTDSTGVSWQSSSAGVDGSDQSLYDKCVTGKRDEPAYEVFMDGTWKRSKL